MTPAHQHGEVTWCCCCINPSKPVRRCFQLQHTLLSLALMLLSELGHSGTLEAAEMVLLSVLLPPRQMRNCTLGNSAHLTCRRQWLDSAHGSVGAAAMLAENAAEEAAAAAAMGVRRVGAVEDLRCLDENLDRDSAAAVAAAGSPAQAPAR